MSSSIESQLQETYRDAAVGYYLTEVVPNHTPIVRLGLHTRLKTASDLYEYLLIDNQVAHEVQSSPVASAIASLQQYINACLMGMEPGYPALRPDSAQFVEWRDRSSQYPMWAANQQLALYPEVYISPDLRMKKSAYFTKLENDINQNKINLDTVQEAVSAYLGNFEEVANLAVVNGYIDSDHFANGTYYFIGKSRAENQYYWRCVDMNERAYESGTEGPKHDYPTPGAWSDWKKADIAITSNTVERTIRPVYFNNRLFITWVDLIYVSEEVSVNVVVPGTGSGPYQPPAGAGDTAKLGRSPNVQLLFNISYKKYDNSWSAPQTLIDVTTPNSITRNGDTIAVDETLDTVATFDASGAPEYLMIALYAGARYGAADSTGNETAYSLLHTRFLDKNFNQSTPFPSMGYADAASSPPTDPTEIRIRKLMWLQAIKNKGRFQFLSSLTVELKHIETTTPVHWNTGGNQHKIAAAEFSLDSLKKNIIIKTSFKEDLYSQDVHHINIVDRYNSNNSHFLTLRYQVSNDPWVTLMQGSEVLLRNTPWKYAELSGTGFRSISVELRNFDLSELTIPAAPSEGAKMSLTGNKIALDVIDRLKLAWRSTHVYIARWRVQDTVLDDAVRIDIKAGHAVSQTIRIPGDQNDPTSVNLPSLYRGPDTFAIVKPSQMQKGVGFWTSVLAVALNNVKPNNTPGLIYFAHGVTLILDNQTVGWDMLLEKIKLEYVQTAAGAELIAPKINTELDSALGTAEFIDFTDSTIAQNDSNKAARNPIRMNTLFARELINKANIALEALLSWDTQHLPEPAIGAQTGRQFMDFNGANGLYFWELFLHLPFAIAHRLNLERQFTESAFWLGFIFDPARKANAALGAPDYWNVRPLVETSDADYFIRSPIDPDGIAASNPVIYQKAVYFHYIKNLIDRGDNAYRQLTPDSLNEAKLWYVRVLDLLGPRPDANVISQWTAATLGTVATSTSSELRALELSLQAPPSLPAPDADEVSEPPTPQPTLRLSTFGSDPTLADVDNAHFMPPFNAELVKHWDTLASRLYNLRHNFTLDGKPLSLPLFAAPLDPRALLAAYASGGGEGAAGKLLAQEVPHYRYNVIYARASAAVETLIQFANSLFLNLERKDQADYQELQQAQAWEFSQFAIDLQLEAQAVEQQSQKALEASLIVAQGRHAFYAKLADENVSSAEKAAAGLHATARIAYGVSYISAGIAAGMKVIPNHIGMHAGATGGMAVGAAGGAAVGGQRLEGIPEVVAVAAHATAALAETTAEALDRAEQYRRRLQEWEHSRDQAQLEVEQIEAQLAVHQAQTRVTAIQLEQAHQAKEQAEKMYAFLKNQRFTNSQLYVWLSGQLSMLYYQAYDVTLSLCMAAQSCWQFERGDYSSSFIQPGAWKDDYKGLTAGENLKLNLLRMDSAWLSRHERLLEITKTVSVRQLPPSTKEVPTLNQDWPTVVARLNDEGIAEFEITQAMLDADYPGHTTQRIKRVSVSLPVTVGPYQDIRATLTQTYSAVQFGSTLKENMRASQQIAVSTGIDDDGMFVFNFDDERYLPFEGTGVISRWNLTFPNPASQQDMIASITDIIVHIHYTAKHGVGSAGTLGQAAQGKVARKK